MGLAPLEVASGYVFGQDPDVQALPTVGRTSSARRELEAAVLDGLRRPPCLVAFSGGLDSSTVLALAVHVARREGLPLPIPYTARFPSAAETEESDWQELVIRHLGVDDWVRTEVSDELDVVGPVAKRALAQHGLYWPLNAHFFVPALEAARGGSLFTGMGGDQLLDPGRNGRIAAILALRASPTPRDVKRLALAAAPSSVRAAVRRRRDPRIDCPWLRPSAVDMLAANAAKHAASEPVRRRAWVEWTLRDRAMQTAVRSMAMFASAAGAELHHPFAAPAALAAFGELVRKDHPQDRSAALRALVGDLLPAAVCERRSKAVFSSPFWNRHATVFASTVRAEEVESDLVDGARAVEYWTRPEAAGVPVFRSLTLLQSVWLRRLEGASADRVEQPAARELEGSPVAGAPQLEAR